MIRRSAIVVEDETFLRSLIATSLTKAGFAVQTASSGKDALKLISLQDPDVVILDIDLGPGPTGLDIGEALLAQSTKTAVVYLTMLADPRFIDAKGSVNPRAAYLNKRLIGDEGVLVSAIEAVLRETDLTEYRDDKKLSDVIADLSSTQLEILALLAEGKTNQQIAEIRGRSLSATEGTISRTFIAMGLNPSGEYNARVLAVRTYMESAGRLRIRKR